MARAEARVPRTGQYEMGDYAPIYTVSAVTLPRARCLGTCASHRRRGGGVRLVLGAADASVAVMPLHAAQAAGLIWAGIGGKRLLDHPFYRRWEAGTLAGGELAAYAGAVPADPGGVAGGPRRVASNLPDGPARAAVHANLSDELGRPAPHLDLFDAFAAAAGARCGALPARATRSLTGLQLSAAASDPVRGLGVLAAYETQAAAVAADESRRAAPLLRHRRPRRGVLGCARGSGSRPRRLDGQRAGRHRRQPGAGDQRGRGRRPRLVAVPRRTPDRRVAHRPRDHRDAGQGAVRDGLGEVVRVLPASAGRRSRAVKAVGVTSVVPRAAWPHGRDRRGWWRGRWYGAGLEDSRSGPVVFSSVQDSRPVDWIGLVSRSRRGLSRPAGPPLTAGMRRRRGRR